MLKVVYIDTIKAGVIGKLYTFNLAHSTQITLFFAANTNLKKKR